MAEQSGPIVIVGAGGHARVLAEAAAPRVIAGHLSPVESGAAGMLGPRLGDESAVADLAASGHQFAIGIGFVDLASALRRSSVLDGYIGVELATICHATSWMSPTARLDDGVFVGARAVVGTGTRVGRAAIINTGAIVDHDGDIGDNSHIGPGAVLSGGVTVGANTLIGVGATVLQGVRIGSNVVVGAGAVVVGDLDDNVIAVGVPARTSARRS